MRKRRAGLAGAFGASALAIAAVLAVPSGAAAARFATVHASVAPAASLTTGAFRTPSMSVELVLAPSHGARLQRLLAGLYDAKSSSYRHFLHRGQFAKRFAPSRSERAGLARYLRATGLAVKPSSSPFLLRASGSSGAVSSAFRTNLQSYRTAAGVRYFANATAVHLPASLARGVLGVVGLTNTIRLHAGALSNASRVKLGFNHSSGASSCETGYPTISQLVTEFVDNGPPPTLGYGGGPGCSGLTPSQDNSIYSAPRASSRTQGAGVNAALFELSAYQESDIDTWAHQFYGNRFNPSLININADGGPLNPQCPAGDSCPPEINGFAGDIEVDADIEMTLAAAPDVRHIVVYNAPNDQTGQTSLDEYALIAKQDIADTTSSSWGTCENDVTAAYTQAENVLFEQMAAQGQSLFTSSGDSGAFGCLLIDGGTEPNIGDPGGQPFITDVGGTTFFNFNPGHDPNPGYGGEEVWNPRDLCNTSANEFGISGLDWCFDTGADGGGVSQFWGRPAYQVGPGVNNRFTTFANGSSQCTLARRGTPCREVPDISLNADQYTPYSEFCTGNASTPESFCGTFADTTTPPGWFGIGGTSLSSPFMSAIIADRDSFTDRRTGLANPLLYALFDSRASGRFFHDIVPTREGPNDNGLYPATPGFDLATGIGSPIMASIITGSS
jgi:subtilase family serine protease